jgi:hypothetical protein
MNALVITGTIGYLIIGLTVLELVGLAAYRRLTGAGPALADSLPNILAGDFILLAWPLSRIHWSWSAACLLGALVAHCTDMLRRWQTR